MKHTKQLLALLLTLAMALGLGASAAFAQEAAAESTVNWDEFYIVTQPQNLNITSEEGFALRVAVNLPAGVNDIEYQWYANGRLDGETALELHQNPGDPYYPAFRPAGNRFAEAEYHLRVTVCEKDADGNVILKKELRSAKALVQVEHDYYITAQPQNVNISHGKPFTLSVAAHIPDGYEAAYQWYWIGSNQGGEQSPIEGATEPVLRMEADHPFHPSSESVAERRKAGGSAANRRYSDYQCKITVQKKDAAGNVTVTDTMLSSLARATSKNSLGWVLFNWFVNPFIAAGTHTLASILLGSYGGPVGILFMVLLSPLLFLYGLFSSFLQGTYVVI